MTHAELVRRAARWLMNTRRCCIVVTEPHAPRVLDIPDAIGWAHGTYSIVIECKTSLSDYYADGKKAINRLCGYGTERWYLCEPHILEPQRIRDGWGLLWAYPKQTRRALQAPLHPATFDSLRQECQYLYRVGHVLWRSMHHREKWGLDHVHLCPLNDALTREGEDG